LTPEEFARAQEEWDGSVTLWEPKQEKINKAEARTEESAACTPPSSAHQSTEDPASGMEQDFPPAVPTYGDRMPETAAGGER